MVQEAAGNNTVIGRIENIIVHAYHNVFGTRLFHRRGHQHPLHALIQIGLQHVDLPIYTAGLDHQITAGPVGFTDGFIVSHADTLPVDFNLSSVGNGFLAPATMDAVKVKQVGQRGGIGARVVDGHKLHIWPAPGGPQGQTTDSAKSINAYFDLAHGVLLMKLFKH